jgi:hypothetical protein
MFFHLRWALWRQLASTVLALLGAVLPAIPAWAQSSACNANEDVVTFNFAAAASSSASGSSVT